MQISETFSKVVGIALLFMALIASVIFLAQFIPPNHVHAQNAGNVGIQPVFQPVFLNQGANAASAIFQDVGQGSGGLHYCNTGFQGGIIVEWEPIGTTTFLPLQQASFFIANGNGPDSLCHDLPVGNYYPNMRARVVNWAAGTVSAWYTGMAAPVSFVAPGLGSNGPTSPIVCDRTFTVGVANGVTHTGINPLQTGDVVAVCGFSVSFQGATSAGSVQLLWGLDVNCATGAAAGWVGYTTSSTPQTFVVPIAQRSPSATAQYLCFVNTSGVTANFNISWASVHGL